MADTATGAGSTESAGDYSEAQIAVHWQEEKYFEPPAKIKSVANASTPEILERFGPENFPNCFEDYANLLSWDRKWDTVLDTSHPPFWKWFVGGKLNACANCVDRHLETRADKNALIWVPELEEDETQYITYRELHRRVNEFAALLQGLGVKTGDRVTLHLPMVPELPITMLACARLGVIHSQVFGGFSGAAAGHRIADSGSKILITIDGYYRAGKMLDHKVKADEAVVAAQKEGAKVERVLVWRRKAGEYQAKDHPMVDGRDFFVDDLLKDYAGKTVEPVSMPAEGTLFLMYTSGTTGSPKGAQHSIGGYLSYVTGTSKYYQDIHPDDVYWCFADIGWITGHSYIVYGPLALGTASVMYEGVPTYPDAGRPWRIAEKLGVNIFHTSPTTVRMLRRVGPDEPAKYNYHFKTMTTVGEPIEPDVWRWYYHVIGKDEAAITDTWWQTENGGFLASTLPGLQKMKPGSAGPGALGIQPVIYDDNGNEVPKGSGKAGNICIRNPWPGAFLTIWGQDERYVKTYYERFCKDPGSKDWRDWPYMSGDGAMQGEDGYFRILGRIDDVINVAGHRLGTKELENATLKVDEIAEAAAVPVIDEVRGRVVEMYVSVKPGIKASKEIEQKVADAIDTEIGKIARPKNVWIVDDMPKTRSGKIMRRVIAGISNFAGTGDISTLANGEVVEHIRHHVQSEKLARGDTPRELTEQEAGDRSLRAR